MRTVAISATLVVCFCFPRTAESQAQELQGKWTLVSGAPRAAAPGPLWRDGTIIVDGSTVTFQTMNRVQRPDGSWLEPPALSSVTYRTDGTAVRPANSRSNVVSASASWVTNALSIRTQYQNQDRAGTFEDIVICSLVDRDTLNVVVVEPVLSGNHVMGTSLLVYKRIQ